MQSPKWIKYRKAVLTEDDGTKSYLPGAVRVEAAYTRVYHSALPIMAKLTVLERNLLDHFCAVMSPTNYVVSNHSKRQSFISDMGELGVTCTDASVIRAIAVLVRKGFLLKAKRGSYQVNPEYFMKNKAVGRDELIKQNYEHDQDK